MTITNAFRRAVQEGNILSIRIMMKNSLLIDPSCTEFNRMDELVSKDNPELYNKLYDKHDGEQFDSTEWNDDYLNTLMASVLGNFSKKRLDHLKEVVRQLRPKSENTDKQNNSRHSQSHKKSYFEQKREDESNGCIMEVVSGCAVGAVVVGGIAAIAGGGAAVIVISTVVGAAAGAAVGGFVINKIIH